MNDTSQMNMNFEMRKKFLFFIMKMVDKKMIISTFKGADTSGILRSADINLRNWHFLNVNTPIGIQTETFIRGNDIVFIKYSFRK